MLREVSATRQIAGESPRRWFFSHEQDLLVWYGADGSPDAFQLSYDKMRGEHAIRWRATGGFGHYEVDDGEEAGSSRMSPILHADGAFPALKVIKRFLSIATELPPDLVQFIVVRLREHPEFQSPDRSVAR